MAPVSVGENTSSWTRPIRLKVFPPGWAGASSAGNRPVTTCSAPIAPRCGSVFQARSVCGFIISQWTKLSSKHVFSPWRRNVKFKNLWGALVVRIKALFLTWGMSTDFVLTFPPACLFALCVCVCVCQLLLSPAGSLPGSSLSMRGKPGRSCELRYYLHSSLLHTVHLSDTLTHVDLHRSWCFEQSTCWCVKV